MNLEEKLNLSVSEISIPVRIANRLQEFNIHTVHDLLKKKPEQILQIPQLGEKALDSIYEALEKIDFHRKVPVHA